MMVVAIEIRARARRQKAIPVLARLELQFVDGGSQLRQIARQHAVQLGQRLEVCHEDILGRDSKLDEG